MAYLRQGRNQEAYRSMVLVRRLYPGNWMAPLGLAVLQAGAGNRDTARPLLVEALDLGGDTARAEAEANPILSEMLAELR